MVSIITAFHIINIIVLILVVMVQSGKGAEVSATFGGGSQTLFGSSGGANFFTYLTAGFAGLFMITSVALTVLGTREARSTFDSAPIVPGHVQKTEPMTEQKALGDPAKPVKKKIPATTQNGKTKSKPAKSK